MFPGGSLICSYARRLGPFLGVQKLEFQYLFIYFFFGGGGSEKNEYFWGYEDFADI